MVMAYDAVRFSPMPHLTFAQRLKIPRFFTKVGRTFMPNGPHQIIGSAFDFAAVP
jgi:hypothetical protein